MTEKVIAKMQEWDINNFEVIVNKLACAEQAVSPLAMPKGAPATEARKFFRNAFSALADYRYLRASFWRDLVEKFKIAEKDTPRLFISLLTNQLVLTEKEVD
jgi:hypothetical protein